MSVGEAGEEQEEEGAAGESDDGDADGDERASMVDMIIKNDPGVLAATGISGALVGWSLVHPLDIGLDLLGAVTGEQQSGIGISVPPVIAGDLNSGW